LPEPGNAAVQVDLFDQQLTALKEAGYHFIDTIDLQNWFDNDLPRNKKYTMLTFDDGWADNLFYATPILQKHSVRAVLALNTGFTNTENKIRKADDYAIIDSKQALAQAAYDHNFQSFMTWQELRELKESGLWDIQCHGNSHIGCYQNLNHIRGFYPESSHWTMEHALGEKPFPGAPRPTFYSTLSHKRTLLANTLKNELKSSSGKAERLHICKQAKAPIEVLEKDNEFRERVKNDLLTNKRLLSEHLNIESDSFFWPWGHHSEISRSIARECGFKQLFTMNKTAVTLKSDPFQLPRIAAPMSMKKFYKQITIFSNPLLRGLRNFFSKKKSKLI
jgi:hypothetical protein